MVRGTAPLGDAMDWFLVGHYLGFVYWPLLLGAGIYIVGWVISLPREQLRARQLRTWFRAAAIVSALALLAALLYLHLIAKAKL